jgi:hypothetical protein
MKGIHVIGGIGGALVLALAGWYIYMTLNPPYEQSRERGFDPTTAVPVGKVATSAASGP